MKRVLAALLSPHCLRFPSSKRAPVNFSGDMDRKSYNNVRISSYCLALCLFFHLIPAVVRYLIYKFINKSVINFFFHSQFTCQIFPIFCVKQKKLNIFSFAKVLTELMHNGSYYSTACRTELLSHSYSTVPFAQFL